MRSLYLWGSALGATLASAQYVKRVNFNSSSPLSSPSTSIPPSPGLTLSSLDSTLTKPTTSLTSSSSSSLSLSSTSSASTTSTASTTSPTGPSSITHPSSLTTTNATSLVTSNATAPAPTSCTGCVLEAYFPLSFWYREEDHSTAWTSIVVTQTVLVLTITYMQGTAIDTIITTRELANQTKTVVGTANQTITHTTRSFTQPVGNTILTFAAGPTYVAYTDLFGGLEKPIETDTDLFATAEPTCDQNVDQLYFPSLRPTRTEDWSAFIQTITGKAPDPDDMTTPFPLPPALLQRLKRDPDVQAHFSGSDIDTCTQYPSRTFALSTFQPFPTSTANQVTLTGPATTETSTFLSTTYQSTSVHVTRQGCLRCDTSQLIGLPIPTIVDPIPSHADPIPSHVDPIPSQVKPNDDPHVTENPDRKPPTDDPGQTITIGDTVVTVHPAQPTQSDQQNPGVVIGSQTLTAGQTTTIDGVVVVVPSGDASKIVVGDSTITLNAAPTGPPVLTVGDKTITADPQGQFVVGTQTLTPGGPAITVDGSTLSLGPSGTIAVIDGVTQTLGHAPLVTGAPVITVAGKPVTATLIGGTTQFVLGPGQTLTRGGVLTIDGTTFSMPWDSSGSTIVINGVTSTLDSPGLPIITLNNRVITASVQGGTTAFVLGPDKTLYPGGVLTVSGTTYSMPFSASGSVVVINGVTTTLGQVITAAPLLTLDGKTYTATTRDGTTEYVISPGVTLRPGDVVTIDGTTYSLDPKGTALVINGATSSIRTAPATNSATTTATAKTASSSISTTTSTSDTSSDSSQSSTTERAPANFIASGIGISKTGGAATGRRTGLDMWVESLVVGVAGWLMFLL